MFEAVNTSKTHFCEAHNDKPQYFSFKSQVLYIR